METLIVWVLIVSSMGSNNQLGPYTDKISCERVMSTRPLMYFTKECIEITIPKQK